MKAIRLRTLAALASAALPLAALAQSPAPAAPRAPCATPQDRQFDFWLGDWNVTDRASGKPAGTNRITSELKGCVLEEHWNGAGGGNGFSFNHYDAARKLWHQTWVDDSGGILYLDGGLRDGAMVLSGRRQTRAGKTVVDRITYTHAADGSVRQHWETSPDGGTTWTTSFDGIYRKR